ncbi:MAG: NAD(P)-binding protein, partial [Rhodospirillaceae bacterium]|nr:NAD(P)-binding protein [Rhodospirillaceae bacterium]
MTITKSCDVAIIGAGPAGAVAASLLAAKGYDTVILERQEFPRFSIGESLLPQCMEVLDEAGMLDAVVSAKFQLKNGAAFERNGDRAVFDFSDKFSLGCSTAFEVQRDRFDKILADRAAASGAAVHYRCEITGVDLAVDQPVLSYLNADGTPARLRTKFCLDASGFGQTLAKLQNLVRPTNWPARESIFTHVVDRVDSHKFDRGKILITIHPAHQDIWFWLIPFSDGSSSLGVVAAQGALDRFEGDEQSVLRQIISETGELESLLANAEYHKPCARLTGYASEVEKIHGENFAMLGNASGFLDPVFSSGVTIALKSSSLAANCLDRRFRGQKVDW